MRKILFLDFDGVLHPDEDPPFFTHIGEFEKLLLECPEIEVVIRSSWRVMHPFEELKAYFDPQLRDRIIGVTPTLDCGYQVGGRQREIEAYLAASNLNNSNALWIALDDRQLFFDQGCPFLVLVDPNRCFGADERRDVLSWYNRS